MYRIILCATPTEAAVYAREQGWKTGTYRFASKASTIRGLRVAEIHQLASWEKRLDKHAVENTFRFARHLERHLIDDGWTWPRPKPGPEQPELPFVEHDEPIGPEPAPHPGPRGGETMYLPGERDRVNDPEAAALMDSLLDDYDPVPSLVARGVVSDEPPEPEPEPEPEPVKLAPKPRKPKAKAAAEPKPEPQPIAALDFGSGATDWFS